MMMGTRKFNNKRTRIRLPAGLVEQVSARLPEWQRNLLFVKAINAAAGSWREEDYPELNTPADIDRWIMQLRQQW